MRALALRFGLGLLLLGAPLLCFASAASASVVIESVTVPTTPIEPETSAPPFQVTGQVECQALRGRTATQPPGEPAKLQFAFLAPEYVVIEGRTSQDAPLGTGCLTGDAFQPFDATFTLSLTRQAPGLWQIPARVTGGLSGSPPPTAAVEKAAQLPFYFIAAPYFLVQAEPESKTVELADGRGIAVFRLTNHGNIRVQVSAVGAPDAPAVTISSDAIILDTANNGGKQTSRDLRVVFKEASAPGTSGASGTSGGSGSRPVTVLLVARAADDSAYVAEPTSHVVVLHETGLLGMLAPLPAAAPLGVALMACAAWASRRAR